MCAQAAIGNPLGQPMLVLCKQLLTINYCLLIINMTDICGICGAGPANFGSIYYVGVSRCGLCLDWEIDNADPLYFKFLDNYGLWPNQGAWQGHGCDGCGKNIGGHGGDARAAEAHAKGKTRDYHVPCPKAFGRAKSCSSQRAEGDNRKAKAPKGHADS